MKEYYVKETTGGYKVVQLIDGIGTTSTKIAFENLGEYCSNLESKGWTRIDIDNENDNEDIEVNVTKYPTVAPVFRTWGNCIFILFVIYAIVYFIGEMIAINCVGTENISNNFLPIIKAFLDTGKIILAGFLTKICLHAVAEHLEGITEIRESLKNK